VTDNCGTEVTAKIRNTGGSWTEGGYCKTCYGTYITGGAQNGPAYELVIGHEKWVHPQYNTYLAKSWQRPPLGPDDMSWGTYADPCGTPCPNPPGNGWDPIDFEFAANGYPPSISSVLASVIYYYWSCP